DSNALCGDFIAAHGGRRWGQQYRNGGLGKGVSTDPRDAFDYAVRMYLEPPGTARTYTENPDWRLAGGGFGRPVQGADATIFVTRKDQLDGHLRYEVIGISREGAVVSLTPLDFPG